MALTSTNRALIAVFALALLAVMAAELIYQRLHRPLSGVSVGQPPGILAQLPPAAPSIAYVDVAALRNLPNSPLTAVLGLTQPGPREDRGYSDFVRDTGFDYTRDLDRVALALWPSGLGSSTDTLGQNRAVAIADGRFNEQKIKAYALRSGKAVARGPQTLYEVPGNPTIWLAFLSPTRLVLASGENAGALLNVANLPARDLSMQARIDRVAGAPIFAVARTDNLPSGFYANFANSPQLSGLARSVRGLTLAGQPDGDRIRVTLEGECDSMKNALAIGTLLDSFRMFGAMALSDPKTRRQMSKEQAAFLDAVINQLKITHQDRWVRLSLDITPQMLVEAAPRSTISSPSSLPANR
jgi:hypothetical protein